MPARARPTGLPLDLEIVLRVLRWTVFYPLVLVALPFIVNSGAGQRPSSPGGKAVLICCCTLLGLRLIAHLVRVAIDSGPRWFLRPRRVTWPDQLVVVTGGASGLGAVLAERLADLGATVVTLDILPGNSSSGQTSCKRSLKHLAPVANLTLGAFPRQISSITLTVTFLLHRPSPRLPNLVRERLGSPTMLVQNAGVVNGKLLLDMTDSDVQKAVGVNYLAHFWTTQAFLPDVLDCGRGHILTVSSVMGFVGCARMVDYCSSKAACLAFHEALQFELSSQYRAPQVFTSVLCPSLIEGPMFSTASLASSPIFRFLSPTLRQKDVVDAIVRALGEEESKTIMLPSYVHLTFFVRWIPGVRQLAQWVMNADHSFDRFRETKPLGSPSIESPSDW